MEEYNNKDDFDGTWGIYDIPFFNYFSDYLSKEQEPFVSCFFSLSSHPPYNLPKEYKDALPNGTLDIHKTIYYTDLALKHFFNSAKKESWYKNTLFLITADHTSPETNKKRSNKIDRYSIPMIYLLGDNTLKGKSEIITQQIDVMPTILDIIGYNKKFFSFGKSSLQNESWAISFINNEYLLIHEEGFLIGRDESYTNFSDINLETKSTDNEQAVQLLKAIKQKYNNRLNRNKIIINEN